MYPGPPYVHTPFFHSCVTEFVLVMCARSDIWQIEPALEVSSPLSSPTRVTLFHAVFFPAIICCTLETIHTFTLPCHGHQARL